MKSLMEVNISLEIIRQTFRTHKHEKKKGSSQGCLEALRFLKRSVLDLREFVWSEAS